MRAIRNKYAAQCDCNTLKRIKPLRYVFLFVFSVAVFAQHAGTGSGDLWPGRPDGRALHFSPGSLSFGAQTVGSASLGATTTVTNTGNRAVTLSSVALGGTNSGDFAIRSNTCGSTLTAGSSCVITVTITPTATGPRSASIVLTDNATFRSSPQSVALSATGMATSLPPPAVMYLPGWNSVQIQWGWVANATSFVLSRGTTSGGPYSTTVYTCNGTGPPSATGWNGCLGVAGRKGVYTDTGVTNGNTYYYVLTATVGDVVSGNSAEVAVTPGSLTGIQGVGLNTYATITATNFVRGSYYNFQRCSTSSACATGGGTWTTLSACSGTTNTTSTCFDSGLTNGTTYYYRAYAVDTSNNTSGNTSIISVTPSVPAVLTNVAVGGGLTTQPSWVPSPGIPNPLTQHTSQGSTGVQIFGAAEDLNVYEGTRLIQEMLNSGKIPANHPRAAQVDVAGIDGTFYHNRLTHWININTPEFPIGGFGGPGSAQVFFWLPLSILSASFEAELSHFLSSGYGDKMWGPGSPYVYVAAFGQTMNVDDGTPSINAATAISIPQWIANGLYLAGYNCNVPTYDPSYAAALQLYGASGGIWVCAAGDSGILIPARMSYDFAIGGGELLTTGGCSWDTASHGPYVKFVASYHPGMAGSASKSGNVFEADTNPPGVYTGSTFSATSYTGALAASVVADLVYAFPNATRADIFQALADSALKCDQTGPLASGDWSSWTGFGFIQLDGAINLLNSLPSGQHMVSLDTKPPNFYFWVPIANGSSSFTGQTTITAQIDTPDNSDLAVSVVHSVDGMQVTCAETGSSTTTSHDQHNCTFSTSGLTTPATHTYSVTATDQANNSRTATVNFTF